MCVYACECVVFVVCMCLHVLMVTGVYSWVCVRACVCVCVCVVSVCVCVVSVCVL